MSSPKRHVLISLLFISKSFHFALFFLGGGGGGSGVFHQHFPPNTYYCLVLILGALYILFLAKSKEDAVVTKLAYYLFP